MRRSRLNEGSIEIALERRRKEKEVSNLVGEECDINVTTVFARGQHLNEKLITNSIITCISISIT